MIDLAKINIIGLFNRPFYYLQENTKAGDLVEVRFNGRTVCGLCVETIRCTAEELLSQEGISPEKLLPVQRVLYPDVCGPNFIKFLMYASEYNMVPLGSILEIALPSILTKQTKRNVKKDTKEAQVIKGTNTVSTHHKPLNSEQQAALDAITTEENTRKAFTPYLINGVTGSGKTRVYVEAVLKRLLTDQDSQALIMMPEISLTPSIASDIESKFGLTVGRWHSSMTPAQRRNTIQSIIDGKTRVVVGARSAVFLPYKKLAIIVVDEEHDHSYKQEESPVYQARDMAVLRASIEGIPIILASATPSIESYNNALFGRYQMLRLCSRFGDALMPKIQIIDLTIAKKDRGSMLSDFVKNRLIETVKAGNLAMIFLNRRGYAKVVRCENCDFVFNCINCTNKLTFHKKNSLLKCHYCEFTLQRPQSCPSCQKSGSLCDSVPGVEMLKEEVGSFMGELAKVSVFSSDEVSGKDKIIEKIAEINSGDFNVIIGTQIVSKGHNFPNLALVVVVGFDSGSNQNDLRIFEKLYQLLTQVAGRAGRDKKTSGEVLIQTMTPNHLVLKAIINGDQDKFYREEIGRRKSSTLPPFSRQANIIISSESEEMAKQYAIKVSQELRNTLRTEQYSGKVGIAGPSASLMPYLKRKYRYSILLDSEKAATIRSLVSQSGSLSKSPSKVQIKIDVDPYNFS